MRLRLRRLRSTPADARSPRRARGGCRPEAIACHTGGGRGAGPQDFAELLLLPGIGARTVASVAFVAEVLHGAPCRFRDPARFLARPWWQGRHPFPVPLKVYDETIAVLKRAVAQCAARPARRTRCDPAPGRAGSPDRCAAGTFRRPNTLPSNVRTRRATAGAPPRSSEARWYACFEIAAWPCGPGGHRAVAGCDSTKH